MEISFTLNEKDYLNFQLYYVSANQNIRKQRKYTQFAVSGILIGMGAFFLFYGDRFTGLYFLIGSIPTYYICGWYSKLLYRFSLRNHVANLYRKTTPREASLSIIDNEMEYRERGLTQQKKIEDVQKIIELKKYFYIQFSETSIIIIPKIQLADAAYVQQKIIALAERHNIPFFSKLSWRWI